MSKEFIGKLKGTYTPVDELIDLFMLPIPADVGPVQCTLIRDKKGMNKFWPKYSLHLSDPQKTLLLQSSKIKTSKTPHYKIEIKTGNDLLAAREDGGYLGRLRSNFQASEFYLYDGGAKEEANKLAGPLRRQFATIIYTADQMKTKKPRKIQVYLPMVDSSSSVAPSWPDTELKKTNIGFEYK